MFGLGAISTFISKKLSRTMMKISAIIIMILGFNMVSRGMVLSGVEINFNDTNSTSTVYTRYNDITSNANNENDINNVSSTNDSTNQANISQSNNVQEIHSTITSTSSYPTITVKAGIPVKWTISADKKFINGCNGEIVIPKYNVTKELNVGDTVIEFTPTEAGNFAYSCWMGMVRGKIKVVADDNSAQVKTQTQSQNQVDNSSDNYLDTTGLPSCCGGY